MESIDSQGRFDIVAFHQPWNTDYWILLYEDTYYVNFVPQRRSRSLRSAAGMSFIGAAQELYWQLAKIAREEGKTLPH